MNQSHGLKVWHTCTLEYFYANYSVHKGVHHADMSQTKFSKLNQLLFMLFWETLYKKIDEEEICRRHILYMKIGKVTQMPENIFFNI